MSASASDGVSAYLEADHSGSGRALFASASCGASGCICGACRASKRKPGATAAGRGAAEASVAEGTCCAACGVRRLADVAAAGARRSVCNMEAGLFCEAAAGCAATSGCPCRGEAASRVRCSGLLEPGRLQGSASKDQAMEPEMPVVSFWLRSAVLLRFGFTRMGFRRGSMKYGAQVRSANQPKTQIHPSGS